MKKLVIENDLELSSSFISYLKRSNDGSLDANRTFIFNAVQKNTKLILDIFRTHVILEFQPTQITFSQYNLMIMAMYQLIMSDELGIKEIHIFSRDNDLESELRDLWTGKRMYIDQVLPHIKIYQVNNFEEKIIINI